MPLAVTGNTHGWIQLMQEIEVLQGQFAQLSERCSRAFANSGRKDRWAERLNSRCLCGQGPLKTASRRHPSPCSGRHGHRLLARADQLTQGGILDLVARTTSQPTFQLSQQRRIDLLDQALAQPDTAVAPPLLAGGVARAIL